MLYQIPGAKPQIDQGATRQQTYVFQPNQPPDRWFVPGSSSVRDVNRLVPAPPALHQGATVTPETAGGTRVRIFFPRLRIGGVQQVLDVVTAPITQTDVFTLTTNPPIGATDVRDLRRVVPAPPALHQGATIQPSYEFFPNQPELIRWAQREIARVSPAAAPRFEGLTAQPLFQFFPNQPEMRRWTLFDPNRAPQLGPQAQLTGATVQDTSPIPPVTTRPDTWFGWTSIAFGDVLRRLTGPKAQFEGATVQQRFEFFPNQPELSQWARLEIARISPAAPSAVHQGATIQQLFQFFPNQPELIRWTLREIARASPGAPPRFDGATIQPLFQFFPNQPELRRWNLFDPNRAPQLGPQPQLTGATIQDWFIYPTKQYEPRYYVPDLNRYQVDLGARKQFEGVNVVQAQTYVFPVNEPDAMRVSAFLQAPRFLVGVVPQLHQGATRQATFPIFFPNQPELVRYRQLELARTSPFPPARVEGATRQQTYEFFPGQPELIRWLQRELARISPSAVPAVQQGATIQATFPIFFPNQPEARHWSEAAVVVRTMPGAKPPLETIRAVVQSDLFTQVMPDMARFLRLELVRSLGGPRPQVDQGATRQATFEFFPNHPDQVRYALRELARRLGGPVPQVEGATRQQTYEFVPNQPEAIRYALRDLSRRLGGPISQTEGATIQATFIFPPNQPEIRGYTSLQQQRFLIDLGAPRRVEGATRQQTYEFTPNQPELIAWLRREFARTLGGPVAQMHQGATVHQTYEFVPNQPELIAYLRREVARVLGGSALIIPPPPLGPMVLRFVSELVLLASMVAETFVLGSTVNEQVEVSDRANERVDVSGTADDEDVDTSDVDDSEDLES